MEDIIIEKSDIDNLFNLRVKMIPYSIGLSMILTYSMYKINVFVKNITYNHLQTDNSDFKQKYSTIFFKRHKYIIFLNNFLLSFVIWAICYHKQTELDYIKYKDIVDSYVHYKMDNYDNEIIKIN